MNHSLQSVTMRIHDLEKLTTHIVDESKDRKLSALIAEHNIRLDMKEEPCVEILHIEEEEDEDEKCQCICIIT